MTTFTLYLPDSLLAKVDEARGELSRSLWLRFAAEGMLVRGNRGGTLTNDLKDVDKVALQDIKPPSPESTRSPEPTPEIQPGKRANGHRDTCGCLSCERLLGKIEESPV